LQGFPYRFTSTTSISEKNPSTLNSDPSKALICGFFYGLSGLAIDVLLGMAALGLISLWGA
jgi:hypothetical protein